MNFNPNDHLMQIKNRNGASDYLPVQWRLVWFREACPDGSITTELVHLDLDRETEEEGYAWNNETRRSEKIVKRAQGIAIFRATIKDGKGGEASGTKSEKAASFPDFIEKAETGAIGRALAALGYGTQFAPELDEQPRIVDAPVDRSRPAMPKNDDKPPEDAPATDQQINSIRKLLQHLDKPEEIREDLRYLEAKEIIVELSHQYNEQRQKKAEKPEPAQPTSTDNAPVPSKLRKMFAAIGTSLETAQKMTFNGVIKPDDNLTPEDCFRLHQVYGAWKLRYDEKKAS